MFALLGIDLLVPLGLLILSVVQVGFGLAVGKYLWSKPPRGVSRDTIQQAAQTLSQVHGVAGALSAQAGEFANQIQAISKELPPAGKLGDADFHQSLVEALTKISDLNDNLEEQLRSAEGRLEQQTRQLEAQMAEARTDALTGLHNRRAFNEELHERITQYSDHGEPSSLMLVDVDHFKKFNDTYGHQAGDEVLRGVAKVLFANVRESDIVCRYGGEEFAVIMPGAVGDEARRTAERIRSAVQGAAFPVDGRELQVTISGGLSEIMNDDAMEVLTRRADEALYASKAAGRNCAHVHDGQQCVAVARNDASEARASLEYRQKSEQLAEAETDSRTDALTGLPNRRAFSEDLRRRVAQWRRFNTPLSLVLADVDGLGDLNQRYGRDTGDIVLRAVTQFLTTAVREMDVVARFHGDEFVLMLPGTPLDNAVRAAERIRAAISMCKLRLPSGEITFTVSMGVAEASSDDDSVSLMARATTALEASKAEGDNCTHVHNGHACMLVGAPTPTVMAIAG